MPVPSLMVEVRRRGRRGGEGVAGPELRAPHRADTEPFGLADELDPVGLERYGADADAQGHVEVSASCLTPSTVRCMLA